MKFSLHSIAVLLLSGLLVGAAHATDERTLFRLNGLDYNEADLNDELRQRVFEAYAKYRDTMSAVMRMPFSNCTSKRLPRRLIVVSRTFVRSWRPSGLSPTNG